MQYLSQRLAAEPPETREARQPRGRVATGQRDRILDATEALVAEKGAAAATIEAIVKEAGVSSVTFYEHFQSKEECFVAAFDRAVEELRAELREAAPADADRDERLRAGLAALLAAVDAEPGAGAALLRRGAAGRAADDAPATTRRSTRRRRSSTTRSARPSRAGWRGCCGSGSSWARAGACRTCCRG